MTAREFIASADVEKVGNYMNELIAHGRLCKQFCPGCAKAKWNCKNAITRMLNSEIEKEYLEDAKK